VLVIECLLIISTDGLTLSCIAGRLVMRPAMRLPVPVIIGLLPGK